MEPLALRDSPARMAVILVNWRGADDSLECLESLLRCSMPMRIIVCDNASGDGSVEKITAWAAGTHLMQPKSPGLAHLTAPPVAKPLSITLLDKAQVKQARLSGAGLTLVQTGANLGFAGGNNIGIQLALSDPDIEHIWLLNNDTIVDPAAPAAICRAFDSDPRIGMLGSAIRCYYRPGHLQLLNGYRYSRWSGRGYPIAGGVPINSMPDPASVMEQTDFVCGASLAVSRAFAETIGGMEEEYFLYFEEIDWAIRSRSQFHIGYAPDAVVYHKEGGSIGSSRDTAKRSALSEYHLARSKVLFGRRHDPARIVTLILHNMMLAARRITQGHHDKAAAILRGSFNFPFTASKQ